MNNKPLTIVGDGEQKRDFTHVKDVVRAFVMAAKSELTGVFNIGSGKAESINYLAKLFKRQADIPRHIEFLPDRPGEPRITQADNTRACNLLGWVPKVSFEAGAKDMLNKCHLFKDAPLWDAESIAKATETWFQYIK